MSQNSFEIELAEFASHLRERRAAILAAWSRSAESDPKITTSTTLSRAQFYDHMPDMLDALERRLRAKGLPDQLSATEDEAINAEGHGLQRWQQGYNEQEVMREWIWLNECLADELESYARARPQLDPGVMSSAWRLIAQFLVMGMSESVGQYADLQRADASARLHALEDALRELTVLEQQRAQAWREATHDLRGNLSIVNNVATVLQIGGSRTPQLQSSISMLERGVSSLRALLDDLTTQARLDAGREQREVRPFDAAQVLAELCASSQPIAAAHGLFLKTDGPQSLVVEGDQVKMCRIAQNLLLNALHYTKHGGVKVTWEGAGSGPERWVLCVQDTGPGLGTDASAPLSVALDAATRDTQKLEKRAADPVSGGNDADEAPTLPSRSSPDVDRPGEGIGLAIVKRLCELLDATLELQTEPGSGTTFRVTFPSAYPKG